MQTQTQQHQQFLGDASLALPDFTELKFGTTPLPDGVTHDDVKAFQSLYREHCEVSESRNIVPLDATREQRGGPLLLAKSVTGIFYEHNTTHGTNDFMSHPKDKAIFG